jgi:hypothetical protein
LSDRMLPIHRVIENLRKRIVEMPVGDPNFADPRYQPINLSANYFHPTKIPDIDRTICYVDGGNAQIVYAPNFVVELARLHFCRFKGRERIRSNAIPQSIEYYTICCATAEGNRIKYETEFVPVKDEWTKFLPDIADLKFDSFDTTLMVGRQRAQIDSVSNSIRTFAEWSLARHLMKRSQNRTFRFVQKTKI